MEQLLYLMWLNLKTEIPIAKRVALLTYFGSAESVYCAEKHAYIESGFLTKPMIHALMQKNVRHARQEIELAEKLHVRLVDCFSPLYPASLKELNDYPLILYVRGDVTVFNHKAAFCVVGARHCTAYGMSASIGISEQLARCGMIIISGLAVGIDAAAHRGAIRGGGKTIGVLGCGMDINYPKENEQLREDIVKNGAVITEFPFGTPPYGTNFPLRNRILSALSLGVAVMEAGDKSGSLITARHAAEQGKDVYALPGNISNPQSCGTNRLIQDGATLLLGADEILAEYILRYPSLFEIQELVEEKVAEEKDKQTDIKSPLLENGLTDMEKQLYKALDKTPKSIDVLCTSTGLSAKEINTLITMLLIKGKIKEHGGGLFSR